ncbi:nitrate reductase subunit alpha [Georgenia sp. 311]|uniref:nitrate reductase subunit alpha n=1 Tax=Georgenia sp. 311 TaxID=2585134 RepID=UPI001111F3BB|nr:nitrate reductase subunit alpha [Georgenia sp. 311]TNC16889.1 nitrate reductase subunit alpha [Georgenia sp. 311]
MTATKPDRSQSAATDALLRLGTFLRRGQASEDLSRIFLRGGREGDAFYRDRWSHDKVVRSTHGVNCTGSCSWKVYVKDGIITWEAQQTDYPTTGPHSPEYEPRGCPRGAAFSWYTYSPTRIRYPYVRGALLTMYREARARLGDPVLAWADVVEDPERARAYKRARGRGGLVRASWEEAMEIMAAAHVWTTKRYGPDRLAGFTVIPAMSQVSYGAGTRFLSLMGGTILSFYDWYADLPMASPQIFGDQTDVPESADWFNAGYLVMWGSNIPVTRTPDAHFMVEARYRGQKVVAISPDYADNTKFADEWLAVHPGTDGALAMGMGHVILREFHVDRPEPYFTDYVSRFTDSPFLVTLEERDGAYVPGKFLTAADLPEQAEVENAAFKTVMLDDDGVPFVPNGTLGDRWGEAGKGRWNLDLQGRRPVLSVAQDGGRGVEVLLPRFDVAPGADAGDVGQHVGGAGVLRRGVPVREVAGRLVTTVFDLLLAQYGVGRPGLPGRWPTGYEDASEPGTPAWAAEHSGVPVAAVVRIGREFADNARRSGGRSMIVMGAGTNHFFHSDTIYRAMIALVTLTGCQGVNGGGWAHYVGQEKIRPITGFQQYAFALDWQRPTRHMISTAFWYLGTDQWRYDGLPAETLASPLATGRFAGLTTADTLVESAKRGWMPSYPTFDRNPLDITDEAAAAGKEVPEYVVEELRAGRLRFAVEDPDAPENFPRVITVWRSNILGSSSKGNEYFLKHLLGTESAVRAEPSPPGRRPRDMVWREEGAEGKVDLLTCLDFRMTSTTLYSDIVLPAATWYEKHDISTTDMHPFVNSFNPAISPPWQTRTDFRIFQDLAGKVSQLSVAHLGRRRDLLAAPLNHDTPDALATPHGALAPLEETPLVPGVTMPKLVTIERDYPATLAKFNALGPLPDSVGMMTKGVSFTPDREVADLAARNGRVVSGVAAGRPSLDKDTKAIEMILALSGTTNGRLATQGFEHLEQRTGTRLADLAAESESVRVTFTDTQTRPTSVLTSPEWSGSETGGRRYTAFSTNVERLKPWHTLTGRMHFYLDHDWMAEMGETLPVYRPPLDMHRLYDSPRVGDTAPSGEPTATGHAEVAVRYLTPHSKWSIHSEYQDNLFMLSLSRGGSNIWMSPQDAGKIGVRDNEWVEAYNRNGVVVARAVVSHRMPEGTVYMHHATERVVDVPLTETSRQRGGIHNSLTRVLMKPSHLIGGYAQLAYAFNYIGPTGNQRDEVTTIRRRSQEVRYS